MKIKNNGFTLLELLVVIAIIGLLASLILVALSKARVEARNAARKAYALQLREAIEAYFHDPSNSVYPTPGKKNKASTDLSVLKTYLVPKYLIDIPKDPNPALKDFEYIWTNNGADYGLLIPFSNDGGQDCKFITAGGNDNWFKAGSKKIPNCSYSN